MSSSTTSSPNKHPSLRHKIGAAVTPGDRLGLVGTSGKPTTLISGAGTYVRRGHLYASALGTLRAAPSDDTVEQWIISVRPGGSDGGSNDQSTTCPRVGMLVVGRISRVVRPAHASVDIVAIVPEEEDHKHNKSKNRQPFVVPLHEPFTGTLRQNELRPNSSLEVKIEECVRPGDVVLARVHDYGERDYVLSTVKAELGVIRAICESSGCEMRPVSWKEMRCPVSGAKEGRKVAKPRQAVRTA